MNVTTERIIYICIFVLVLFIGYMIGRKTAARPTPAGVIDFETDEEGNEHCVFKLEGDIDWIAKQDTIIFQVRRNH